MILACLPLEHVSAGGLLDHEENSPALKGPFYSTTGHFLPPLPNRVEGRCGTCGNGNLIASLWEPGPIFNAVQHIVRSHNPLSWKRAREAVTTGQDCAKINELELDKMSQLLNMN